MYWQERMPSWVAGARTATWSRTIRLFRLGSQLANEAGGRRQEGKGHEPARTITHAPGAAQVTVAYLPHAHCPRASPQRPERSVSCSSARSCSTVESEAGSSWLALEMNAGTCAAGSGGLIRYP